ncbi:putative inactive leucine-rich repeat receptor kinase XIAO [Vitis vinifera]|nr:putative inactive leucine-rich repeat receptor kinase XIAO [Vitis vinifera]
MSSGFLFHETLKPGCCHGDHHRAASIDTERVALLKFKQGLTDPSHRLSSWVGEDCCKWRGVVCNNRSGHVIKLNLRSLDDDGTDGKLGGEISLSLLDLKYLNHLDLSMNNFEGTRIPKFFGSLERLRYLNLSCASFSGPIPPQLGNLSRLIYLDLKEYFDFNRYPDESSQNNLQWISGLSSLRHLNLEGVNLSRASAYWLHAVSKLPSLSELHLSSCGLSVLPRSLPSSNLTSLSILVLSNNGFNSTIPHWLFQLRNLVYLDLSFNNLRGSILDAFANRTCLESLRKMGSLCNLKTLILSENDLNGEITEMIDVLSGCNKCSLENLNLGLNELGGFLPNSLGNLSNLQSVLLWDNSFVGSIPNSIGNLSNLEELYLSNNQMSGTIPETLGQLNKLVALDISENPWEGILTEAHLSNLINLKELSIAKFSLLPDLTLVINISSEWIPPFKLQYLNLRSCQVGPKFPVWLRNQNELNTLILRNARISDTIPEWFWKLDLELDQLDLGYNQLSGRTPNSLKFTLQSSVCLIWNHFNGSLPLWSSNSIGELTGLVTLEMSNNSLTGEIPALWNGVPNLVARVDLSNNNLSGELPTSNCTNIRTLDLGGNRFSGNIPAWIGQTMPSLWILRLRSNLFDGSIPLQLCTLSSLHILDLAQNNLSGSIPSCVGNLSAMASEIETYRYEAELTVLTKGREDSYRNILYLVNSIDLSNNGLSGDVPGGLTDLSRLGTLNLSMNHLTGKIPDNIGDLQLLETLDLSRNQLSGPIPPGMASLTLMNHLNLSYNNLSGRIPSGNQLQTLDDPSIYWDNPALCGRPITAKCPGDDDGTPNLPSGDDEDDEDGAEAEMKWFYMSMGTGFVVGFWGVCGTLVVKESWRHAYFRLVNHIKEWLLLVIQLNVARLQRKLKLGRSQHHT